MARKVTVKLDQLNDVVERYNAAADEVDRLRRGAEEIAERIHPGYGPCDGFGDGATCSACNDFFANVDSLIASNDRLRRELAETREQLTRTQERATANLERACAAEKERDEWHDVVDDAVRGHIASDSIAFMATERAKRSATYARRWKRAAKRLWREAIVHKENVLTLDSELTDACKRSVSREHYDRMTGQMRRKIRGQREQIKGLLFALRAAKARLRGAERGSVVALAARAEDAERRASGYRAAALRLREVAGHASAWRELYLRKRDQCAALRYQFSAEHRPSCECGGQCLPALTVCDRCWMRTPEGQRVMAERDRAAREAHAASEQVTPAEPERSE